MALKAGRVGVDPSQVDEKGYLIGTNHSTANNSNEEEENDGTQSGQGGASSLTS